MDLIEKTPVKPVTQATATTSRIKSDTGSAPVTTARTQGATRNVSTPTKASSTTANTTSTRAKASTPTAAKTTPTPTKGSGTPINASGTAKKATETPTKAPATAFIKTALPTRAARTGTNTASPGPPKTGATQPTKSGTTSTRSTGSNTPNSGAVAPSGSGTLGSNVATDTANPSGSTIPPPQALPAGVVDFSTLIPPSIPSAGPLNSALLRLWVYPRATWGISRFWPPHWALFICNPVHPSLGNKMHAVGNVNTGFTIEMKRNEDPGKTRWKPLHDIPLAYIDEQYLRGMNWASTERALEGEIKHGEEELEDGVSPLTPRCRFEEVVCSVRAPPPSMRRRGQGPAATRNCQAWVCEVAQQLRVEGIIEEVVVDFLRSGTD